MIIKRSNTCLHDSNIGFQTDFSVDGDVNGWTFYDGIFAYGCWNNFLFGTLYDTYCRIGREYTFAPLPAEDYYMVRIVMQLSIVERPPGMELPKYGKLMWRTLSDTVWNDEKSYLFEINTDSVWAVYNLNMGEAQWWQGDINDLRLYPIYEDGRPEDEFFLRSISIYSKNKYFCQNYGCSYYQQYKHPCEGIGRRGFVKSKPNITEIGTADLEKYTIESGKNDTLLVNINGYGYESLIIGPIRNVDGATLANHITGFISVINIGGYYECEVVYTDKGEFIIYSGTYADDSTTALGDSSLSRYLNFYSKDGKDISEKSVGNYPASGFLPLSSFHVGSKDLVSFLSPANEGSFVIDPIKYNVEGGRVDWLNSGVGTQDLSVRDISDSSKVASSTNRFSRKYNIIENFGRTVIDFNHPFNASGRIKKIYAAVTLDNSPRSAPDWRGRSEADRISHEIKDACIMFFRPLKDGNFMVLDREIPIKNRTRGDGSLYSGTQEYVELECDIFVNRGDFIGVYNANIYGGKHITKSDVDALYFQVDGKPSGVVKVSTPYGDGQSGLLLYARSDQLQNRLIFDIDLEQRANINSLKVVGREHVEFLDYNLARCLDINWEVDLFGGDHTTGYIVQYSPLVVAYFNHPNLYYGKDCLNDGIKTVPDGKAADGFSRNVGRSYNTMFIDGRKDGGSGIILVGAKYFSVNGDAEWLIEWLWNGLNHYEPFILDNFKTDPIAFTLKIPYEKEKSIYKSKIFFKERLNFRSFALSLYRGDFWVQGNADDPRFELIPYRKDHCSFTPWTKIILDDNEFIPENKDNWGPLEPYLQHNPAIGHPINVTTGVNELSFDKYFSYWDPLAGFRYSASGYVSNNEQWAQACNIDWNILEHNWQPNKSKGFRCYCNYHESTKITEFEVYGVMESIGSIMAGSMNISYSAYGDEFNNVQTVPGDSIDEYVSYIGDNPRYIRVEFVPITKISLYKCFSEVSYEDVYVDKKGCNHELLPVESKIGVTGASEAIHFTNVYGHKYDLRVNIDDDRYLDHGLIYYNRLNSHENTLDPEVGPDTYYKKHDWYPIENFNGNVAINCPVYALKNLIDGAKAWFSHNEGHTWGYFGELSGEKNVNFRNLPDIGETVIEIPVLKRSKWWKLGFFDTRIVQKIYEMHVYSEGKEVKDIKFYYEIDKDVSIGANKTSAPHLTNMIVDGSYYTIRNNCYIGFELPEVMTIDKIVFNGQYLLPYENSHNKAGIDSSTGFCIYGEGDHYQKDTIIDVSYYERGVNVVGDEVYCDTQSVLVEYEFEEDFSNDGRNNVTFSGSNGDLPDTDVWIDLANASVYDGRLMVTNSGISGNATYSNYFDDGFDVTLEVQLGGNLATLGWGSFFYAKANEFNSVRIGRIYDSSNQHRVVVDVFDSSGFSRKATVSFSGTYINFRIRRDLGLTQLFYRSVGATDFIKVFETYAISGKPIQFGFMQEYSPISYGEVTWSYINNLYLNDRVDWGENLAYGSSFEFVKDTLPGTEIENYYEYNIVIANFSNASGYKIVDVFDTSNSRPLDNTYAFKLDFVIKCDQFLDYNNVSSNGDAISVGIIQNHINLGDAYSTHSNYFIGAQVVLRRDHIGIAILSMYNNSTSAFASLNVIAKPYYCTFTHDGNGNYHIDVWEDFWAGAIKVVNLDHISYVEWWAGRVGIGSSYSTSAEMNWGTYANRQGFASGRIAAISFECSKTVKNSKVGRSSVKFPGDNDQYLLVNYNVSPKCNVNKQVFDFEDKFFTFDFYVKFSSLPLPGERVEFISCWDQRQEMVNNALVWAPSSWAFVLENVNWTYYFRVYIQDNNDSRVKLIHNISFKPDLQRWYHIYLGVICYVDSGVWRKRPCLFIDGHSFYNTSNTSTITNLYVRSTDNEVKIGRNLDGHMELIRLSSDFGRRGWSSGQDGNDAESGGNRGLTRCTSYLSLCKQIPNRYYQKYYTFSLYDSSDNYFYGKYADVDSVFVNSYSHFIFGSEFCRPYYTYFAVDFGQRYVLEIIRSFPVDTAFRFNTTDNVFFSNFDTDNPDISLQYMLSQIDPSTGFEGLAFSYPDGWKKSDSQGSNSYIIDGFFNQSTGGTGMNTYCLAESEFFFKDDFSFKIDYNVFQPPTAGTWRINIELIDIANNRRAIKFVRLFEGGLNRHSLFVKDNADNYTLYSTYIFNPHAASIKIERFEKVFSIYYKKVDEDDSKFYLIAKKDVTSTFGKEMQLKLSVESLSNGFPKIDVFWDNFKVNYGDVVWSTYRDARWMYVKMLNGDGNLREIKRIGVYSDISVQSSPDGKVNNYWLPLGESITNYLSEVNSALGTTAHSSSHVGYMVPGNAVDGIITEDISNCWASEFEPNPWITLDFGLEISLYRIKVHHGYSSGDTRFLITDYLIQVSEDNENFVTIFNIQNNTQYLRTHDLFTPVKARYLRLYVNSYKSTNMYLWTGKEEGYKFWQGAVLREIEVFSYYGFSIISSEKYPIISIDLRKRYFIKGHAIIGRDTENNTRDWSNADSNFCYSRSGLSDPNKIGFNSWGSQPVYEKWVAIKRNTTVKFPSDTNQPDFLKHVVINATVNEQGRKPNPIEHSWFWKSSFSNLSNDYGKRNFYSKHSLRIDYTGGTSPDHIYFSEGDHFGYDRHCSWRDGLGFDLYIDNIDNLDTSYGYFYFGGYDPTEASNSVVHSWNLSTLSGVLGTGWNRLFLPFIRSDNVAWTPAPPGKRDSRILYDLKFGKIGLVYRGTGQQLSMNIDGFLIERCYFSDYCIFDYGLYLNDHDFLSAPISRLNMTSSTIEFFIRPDWELINGVDEYGDFKHRTLFHFSNVNNDVFGASISMRGIEVYFGNNSMNFNSFIISHLYGRTIDRPLHLAFVFSCDGSAIGSDSSTVHVYVNNRIVGKSFKKWSVSDNKHFFLIIGGQSLLIQKQSSYSSKSSAVSGVISNLKIYNYCKTDFIDSFKDETYALAGQIKPCELIEISKDNVTFNKIGDSDLPYVFKDVDVGEVIPIYVRTSLPDNLTGHEKRTAKVIGSWDIGV